MLINCPECNKQISDKAHFCPNCGLPFDDNIKINKQFSKLPENMLTIKDIQTHLNISQRKAYSLVRSKGFPKITIGHRYFIPKESYEKYIAENLKHKIIL